MFENTNIIELLTNILLVLLGGLFGWILGKLPERWVYIMMALTIIIGILILTI